MVLNSGRARPRGKPPQRDAEGTRSRILWAAVAVFAERGFGHAGVREIAARSDANLSLVTRYFGSKEGLFRAALEAAMVMDPVLAVDRNCLGDHIVALFTKVDGEPNPLAMIILSAADPAARAISIEVLERQVIAPLAAYLGPPNAEERAARLNMLWSGYLIARQLLPLSPLADSRSLSTLRWLARETQAIVDDTAAR